MIKDIEYINILKNILQHKEDLCREKYNIKMSMLVFQCDGVPEEILSLTYEEAKQLDLEKYFILFIYDSYKYCDFLPHLYIKYPEIPKIIERAQLLS